jgi:3-oxoacyl-[acyl-carrier protein] reductase/pteridine reductase
MDTHAELDRISAQKDSEGKAIPSSDYNSFVNELKGKTILITGGARRLGKAIALAAADAGAQVALTYLSSASQAQHTLAEITKGGAQGVIVPCDVRREESVALAVAKVLEKFGRLDVLVNNAGMFAGARFEEITAEQWDNMFAANVRGPFLMSKHCVPALRKTGGRIIHMGSLGGSKPWATHAHYCSSKAALHMLTRVMAKALAPEIAVNCVAPGMIDAMIDASEGGGDGELLKRLAAKTPMGRNGTADDIVNAVMYFATASHFITGQILTVDGGLGL